MSLTRPVTFYVPALKRYETDEFCQSGSERFVGVSVTGQQCALNCPHCEGEMLRHMASRRNGESLFELLKRLNDNGVTGALISGGSDKNGKVPLMPHIDDMARAKIEIGMKLSVHTGLVDHGEAMALKDADVGIAMLDIIGDRETIRDVYGLDATPADFDSSLDALCSANLKVSPHIVIGLNFGKITGESAALDMVAKYPVEALILVVIMPLHGTGMEKVSPPEVGGIKELFVQAREKFGDRKVILGCARPMGPMRVSIDEAALDAGLDGIAYPAPDVADKLASGSGNYRFVEKCCSMA